MDIFGFSSLVPTDSKILENNRTLMTIYGSYSQLAYDVIHDIMCVCVVITFIVDVKRVDAPAGATQKEDHTGFLHLPSAVHA